MAVHLDLVIFMSKLMNKTVIDNQIQILTKKYSCFYLGTNSYSKILSWERLKKSKAGSSRA
jgi:hypothetical protein